jgi:3',5'-cyclic AMP phosphodiesterase CpdA
MLDAAKAEKLFRVVMIHHPPVSQASRHKILLDADIFKRVIAARGAELVLHGHDHRAKLNYLDGSNGTRVPAAGVPSASAAPGTTHDAAAYNLYRIDGAAGAWTCEVIARGMDAGGAVKEQQRMMLS